MTNPEKSGSRFDICMSCRRYNPVSPEFVRTNCGYCEAHDRYVRGLKEPSFYDCESFEKRHP